MHRYAAVPTSKYPVESEGPVFYTWLCILTYPMITTACMYMKSVIALMVFCLPLILWIQV